MPHVTVLYPFLPRDQLARATPMAEEALAVVTPFDVELARFDLFRHRGGTFTVWLAPEPRERLLAVQSALVRTFPECGATSRFAGGFTPHLSVGQARSEEELRSLRRELEAWTPLSFTVRQVSIIVRDPPPRDVFRTFAEVPLGARAAPSPRAGP